MTQVWKLVKERIPLTVNADLYDVSLKPNGQVDHLIGAEVNDPKSIVVTLLPICALFYIGKEMDPSLLLSAALHIWLVNLDLQAHFQTSILPWL